MAGIPRGFTLIEALVVLTLITLLISLGVPAMTDFIRSYQLSTASHALFVSFNQARQASVTRRVPVLVDNQGENWSAGWRVYADQNNNARWDEGEQVLAEVGPQPDGLIIKGNGPVRRFVRYMPTGRTSMPSGAFQAGTLVLCHANGKLAVRKLVISATGRVRRTKEQPGPC
ncbi:GspH/FimT family protein [Pseudomonas sp. BN102]|uniref:GspH/FimT family pseudopilin n=1 Tax=Pseudomonas sp. BN102 TaxID=2567886 RepID=UPI002453815D|nr:GspH/FimT family protein [Pseudomonas sp. BN102]MDH4611115.1 prepilin-type N-terminal cleavage/methylation domain-containing protein [Pseudomonas sp. BN102]